MASNVELELLAEPIEQLDLTRYCLVTADTSVRETVDRMRALRRNCAFIVGKGTHLIGIFTDRDVLKKVVNHPEVWDQPVEMVMTRAPNTIAPNATTNEALRLMEEHHFRNVPVVDQHGTLHGNVTHYAILKFLTDHFPEAVYNLPPDPDQFAEQRDGG
jgi:CBS domain-containing protein